MTARKFGIGATILILFVSSPGGAALKASSPTAPVSRANREALRQPAPNRFTNARQVYAWGDGAIYRLFALPERVSAIALEPGEKLVSVAAGDTARWVVGDTVSGTGKEEQVHILVKPVEAGLATNMVITTDRRTYHMELDSRSAVALAAISWTYPNTGLLAIRGPAPAAEKPVSSALPFDPVGFDFEYSISGDRPVWRPMRAFNDGLQTFIQFPAAIAQSEAPPLFLIGDNGKAELVNYRMRGSYYVVDRLFDRAELRLGEKRQTVVRIERATARSRS